MAVALSAAGPHNPELLQMIAPACLITGGSSGIGRATALLATRGGYRVAIACLPAHFEDALQVAQEISAAGGHAVALQGDVSSRLDIERLFNETDAALGPLSMLVNCAGSYLESRVEELDFEALSHMIAVNFTGVVYCCREAVRRMSNRRGGSGGAIVNVSSMAATIGGRPGASAYAGSKAAVDTFTTGFAREVADQGIRVNSVRPGVTASAMTAHLQADPELRKRVEASIPLGRIGQPEEVAELILWLLSNKASLVTGAHVNVGGGGFHVVGVS